MGTAVAAGTGRAVVTSTGMKTELGKIAHLLGTVQQEDTPLQQRLATVGKTLLVLCVGIVALVAAIGLLRGRAPLEVLMSAVSLAVAAVPEGLTAIVTIALALGVQRMATRHVLIRKLPAVETLGCATVICTDKTGTLTTGVMAVREVWGEDPDAVVRAAALCCDADLDAGTGDPIELALLREAFARGVVDASVAVQIGIQHIPLTQRVFDLGALSLIDCAYAFLLGLIPVSVLEILKLTRRRRR
jgi:Ca2+-transporting ATPase